MAKKKEIKPGQIWKFNSRATGVIVIILENNYFFCVNATAPYKPWANTVTKIGKNWTVAEGPGTAFWKIIG